MLADDLHLVDVALFALFSTLRWKGTRSSLHHLVASTDDIDVLDYSWDLRGLLRELSLTKLNGVDR